MNKTLPLLLVLLLACHQQHEVKHPPLSAARIASDSSKATTPAVDSATEAVPQPEISGSEVTYTIMSATQQAYNQAIQHQTDPVLYDTMAHEKQDGVIRLPLTDPNKPSASFADTLTGTDDTAIRTYLYLGQLPSIGQYIVGGGFWEHSEAYLVDQHTGAVTMLWGIPVLSPSGKFVANLSMPYGLEGEPNGIQVWRVGNGKRNEGKVLAKMIEIDQQAWIPEELVWESDTAFLIKTTSVEQYWQAVEKGQELPRDFTYLLVKMN
ncbi:MAG: hypothetical protein ICV83_28465 [Cytophagales bacterium]|nr:hypothetical protein [Cytophagales bacterium]